VSSTLVLGTIHTLDPARPRADAVLVRDGRIAVVGTRAECEAAADAATERRELGAGCATPGLVDAHGHPYLLGRTLIDVSCAGAGSEAECAGRVAGRARRVSGGGWIVGRGWDHNTWPGGQWPTARSLDAAVGDRPVFLDRVDCHAAWVNSAALVQAGIGRDTPDPPGGRIFRDDSGAPTGVLIDTARNAVFRAIGPPSPSEVDEALRLALAELQRLGLTGAHDAEAAPDILASYRRLAAAGELPVRVYAMVDGQGSREDLERRIAGRGPVEQGLLTVRAVKLFADGALGSRGAALLEPYADAPEERGLVLMSEELRDRLARIAAAGLQPAVHAIGDRACREVLQAYADLAGTLRDLRPRVEHLQIVHLDDWELLRRSGAIASMQPAHAISDGAWVEARIGPARARGAYAWRSAAVAGATLAFGSDFPVESPDPRLGLVAAERRIPRGMTEAWNPSERLDRVDALRAFTSGAAWAEFAEARRGTVRAGFDADLTLWGADLLEVSAAELDAVPIAGTMVAGELRLA
jgi:predicted amidohydrolase YtcJ